MRLNSAKNKITKSRISDIFYQKYIFNFLFFLIFIVSLKTLLDLNIFLSTGRIVSAQDWLNLIFVNHDKMALDSKLVLKRILIISGSNSLFGLSAKNISQKTGLQTINLSSHAGLGGAYILSRSKKFIRKGDIVILPLEYEFYISSGISDDFKRGDILPRFLISYDLNSLKKIPVTSIISFFFSNALSANGKKEYMSYFRGHLEKKDILARLNQQRLDGECYSGYTFNDYGDETCNIGHDDASVNPIVLKTAIPRSISEIDSGDYIQQFVKFATNTGAQIIPLYPVSTYTDDYQDLEFMKPAQKIKKYWEDLGIEFHDSLTDSLLPPNLMFNSHYHPKNGGREIRTKSVIKLIENHIKLGK